jgi:hypothetical protein
MRQWYCVGLGGVLGLQQPTTQPRLNRMKRVTCSGLLSLKKDGALEIVDESAERSVRLVRFNEFVPMNLPHVARYLTDRLARRL